MLICMGISKGKPDLRLVEEEEVLESGQQPDVDAGAFGDVAEDVQRALTGDACKVEPEAKPDPEAKSETVIYGEKEVVIDGRRQKFVLRDFSCQDGTGYEGRYSARLWVPVDEEGKIIDLVGGLLVDQPADERDEWDRRGVHPDLVGFWEGKKFGRLRDGRVVYDKKAQTITVHLPVRRGDALSEEALDEGFCLQGAWGGERNVRAVRQDFDVKKMLPAEFHARFVRPHCGDDEDDDPFIWAARRAAVAKGYLLALRGAGVSRDGADESAKEKLPDYEAIDEIYKALAQRKFNVVPGNTAAPRVYELNRRNQHLCGKIGKHFRMKRRYLSEVRTEHRADLTCFVLECAEFLLPEVFDDPRVQDLLDRVEFCFPGGLNVLRMAAVFKGAIGENGGLSDAGVGADRDALLERSKEALIFTLETVGEVFGGYRSVFDRWYLVEDFDFSCGFDPGVAEERDTMLLLAKRAKGNFANAAAIFHKCRGTVGFEGVQVSALTEFATEVANSFPGGGDCNVDRAIAWASKYVLAMNISERGMALQLLAAKLHSGAFLHREAVFNGLPVDNYELRDADEVKAQLAKTAAENVGGIEESARLKYEKAEQDRRRGVWGVSSVKPRDYRALAVKAVDRIKQLAVGLADNVRYLPGSGHAALPVSPERSAVCAFSRERVVDGVLGYRDSRRTSEREKTLFFRCIEPFLPELVGDCSQRIAKIVRGLADMDTVEPNFLPYLGVVVGGRDNYFKSPLCKYLNVARYNGDFSRKDEQNDHYHERIEGLVVEVLTMVKEGLIEFEDALEILEWISEVPGWHQALNILKNRVAGSQATILKKCYPDHYGPQYREQLLDQDVVHCLQSELSMAKTAYMLQVMGVSPFIRDYAVCMGAENFREFFMRLFSNGRSRIVCEREGDFIDYDEVFSGSESLYNMGYSYCRSMLSPAKLQELFDEGLLDREAFEANFSDLRAAAELQANYRAFARTYGEWVSVTDALLADLQRLPAFLAQPDLMKSLFAMLPGGADSLGALPLAGEGFLSKLFGIFERKALAKVHDYTEGRWAFVSGDADFSAILRGARLIGGGGDEESASCAEIVRLRLGHAYNATLELLARELGVFKSYLQDGELRSKALVKFFSGSWGGHFSQCSQGIWAKVPELRTVLAEVCELFDRRFEVMAEKIIDDVGGEGVEMGGLNLDTLEIGRMVFSEMAGKCISGRSLPEDLARANRLVLTAVSNAQVADGAKLLQDVNGLALAGAENGVGTVAVSGGIEVVRETVRRIADFSRKKLDVLVQALRGERIKAFGMVPTGGKIHLSKEVDNAVLQRILRDHGLSDTSFWVDGSKCVVCPAVPSSGEFVVFLRALAAQGLLDENQASFQLCAVPRLSALDGAIVGGTMMLRTKKPYPVAEGVFETSHDFKTGRRLLIYDDGGNMASLPFMPVGGKNLGRTDIVGRIAFSDAALWQFLRTMHRDRDGGIFEGLWWEFVQRYVGILGKYGMSEVINDSWILANGGHSASLSPDEVEARSRGQAEHFATLKRCTDAAFEYVRQYEETGEMQGVVYEIILLCGEMEERMQTVQARILGADEFKKERKLLLGSEEAVSAEEFYMCLQKS